MAKKKELLVGLGGPKKVSEDFANAWKRAEKGLPPEEPVNRLHFEDMPTLFKYLSPKRFELLQHLRENGPLSIRKLAAQLKRDYKNVHMDVNDLIYVGLIEKNADELLIVPWDTIITELPLLKKVN